MDVARRRLVWWVWHFIKHVARGSDEAVEQEAVEHRVVGDGRPVGHGLKQLEGSMGKAGREVEPRKAGAYEEVAGGKARGERLERDREAGAYRK